MGVERERGVIVLPFCELRVQWEQRENVELLSYPSVS